MKKVVVIGASPNPARYSYVAVKMLAKAGYQVFPIGMRKGIIVTVPIIIGLPVLSDIYIISIFLSAVKQKQYEKYILELRPEKIIINPGAENPNFERRIKRMGIKVQKACTIELISSRSL